MEFVTALRSTSFDQAKPSLFELLSESQLSSLLPPTLRYLLTALTQRYPRYLLRVLNSFDELYALLMLAVERHYLVTRGGSFTEHFYGLKRERCLSAGEVPRAATLASDETARVLRLRPRDIWLNLAVMVGIPYLKRKLDEAFEIEAPRAMLGRAYTTLPNAASIRERILYYCRWFLRNVYPSINAAYYLALLAFNLAYLFDRSRYHSPFMWLIGTRVRRMNAADHRAVETLSKAKTGAGQRPGSAFAPRYIAAKAMSSLSVLLPTSIFALKFLEWWYASDFAKQLSRRAAESLDLPPPVVTGLPEGLDGDQKKKKNQTASVLVPGESRGKDSTGTGGEEVQKKKQKDRTMAEDAPIATPSLLPIYTVPPPEDSQQCPICKGEIVTATACQTGFVYCYTCIHRWITGQHPKQEDFMKEDNNARVGKWESGIGRCAVTGRRILGGTEGLRRIMV